MCAVSCVCVCVCVCVRVPHLAPAHPEQTEDQQVKGVDHQTAHQSNSQGLRIQRHQVSHCHGAAMHTHTQLLKYLQQYVISILYACNNML